MQSPLPFCLHHLEQYSIVPPSKGRNKIEKLQEQCSIVPPSKGRNTIEKLQVVTPDDPPFEKEYYEWQEKLLRKYRKELPKEFEESEAKKAENASTSGWQPAPRVTEADQQNDTKSLQRKLDRRLFLLLKREGGSFADPDIYLQR